MVKCEYHNRNTKIRGRSILTTYILSTYIFWIFWVKDNDLVTIGTFDIFSTAYIISALFRLSTIILLSQNRLSLTIQCHIFFYIIGLKKIITHNLPAHMFGKSVVLFAITSKKDLQARIFTNIYSLVCRKSFHFFLLLFYLIGFLILKGSPDS